MYAAEWYFSLPVNRFSLFDTKSMPSMYDYCAKYLQIEHLLHAKVIYLNTCLLLGAFYKTYTFSISIPFGIVQCCIK